MHIYHATYASGESLYRETWGIRAKNLEHAYKIATKSQAKISKNHLEIMELESIMKGVKAI